VKPKNENFASGSEYRGGLSCIWLERVVWILELEVLEMGKRLVTDDILQGSLDGFCGEWSEYSSENSSEGWRYEYSARIIGVFILDKKYVEVAGSEEYIVSVEFGAVASRALHGGFVECIGVDPYFVTLHIDYNPLFPRKVKCWVIESFDSPKEFNNRLCEFMKEAVERAIVAESRV